MILNFFRKTGIKFLVVLSLFIYAAPVQAHFTGFSHHEIILKYENKRLLVNYFLNLISNDYQKLYPKIDQNADDVIDSSESQIWLDSWKDSFSIEANNLKLRPLSARNFTSKKDLDISLFPVLSFEIDFGPIVLNNDLSDLKIFHNYRITTEIEEYWTLMADRNSLKFSDQSGYDSSTTFSGQWKPVAVSTLDPNSTTTNNSTQPPFMFQNTYKEASNYLNQLVKDPNLSFSTTLILVLIAFFIGASHSLTPGHGKAIIGSYLATVGGNFKDALLMALATTISHTGSVSLVAALFIWFKNGLYIDLGFYQLFYIFDLKSALPYFEFASGAIIVVLGISMLLKRFKELVEHKVAAQIQAVSDQPKQTEHDHAHPHTHTKECGHTHAIPAHKIDLKESLILGFTTGLNPCVDAVAILILAINIERLSLGILILVAFSTGMALTLALIGWSIARGFIFGTKKAPNQKWLQDLVYYFPIISSLIIIILGILIVTQVYR